MGLESFARTLYCPEDALRLRQGKLRNQESHRDFVLDDNDVIDAAEILILLNDANNLCSKADLVERAMSYGWAPVNVQAQSTLSASTKVNHPVRSFWRDLLTGSAKLLLKMAPKD